MKTKKILLILIGFIFPIALFAQTTLTEWQVKNDAAAFGGTGLDSATVIYNKARRAHYQLTHAVTKTQTFAYALAQGWLTLSGSLYFQTQTGMSSYDLKSEVNTDKSSWSPLNPGALPDTTFDGYGVLGRYLNGKLLYVYFHGHSDGGDNRGGIVKRKSITDGNTWSDTTTVYNSPYLDNNPAGGLTPTERFVLFFRRFNFTTSLDIDWGYIYSDDQGETWSTYRTLPHPRTSALYAPYGKMIPIGGGKLMMPYYIQNGSAPEMDYELHVIFSTDNGTTWGGDVTVYSGLRWLSEFDVLYIGGNSIIAISRDDLTPFNFYQFKSEDNGASWTNQGITNFENGDLISPWLNLVYPPNGAPVVVCYYRNTVGFGYQSFRYRYADATKLLDSPTIWSAPHTVNVLSNYGYPSVIHYNGNRVGFGVVLSQLSTHQTVINFFKNNIIFPEDTLLAEGPLVSVLYANKTYSPLDAMRVLHEINIDTIQMADSVHILGYSSGETYDTLIFKIGSNATSPTGKPRICWGTNETATGKSLVVTQTTVTTKGVVTKKYALNNPVIPCGNTIWMKFDGTPSFKYFYIGLKGRATFPEIGDSYGGGIVFYTSTDGLSGLIAATHDQSASAVWGCETFSIPFTSTTIGTGVSNTAEILKGCKTTAIAAYLCDTLTLNGYTDWFLPSKDELAQMYLHKTAIGGFIGDWYHSSSEASYDKNWALSFVSSDMQQSTKATSKVSVRAIRAYNYSAPVNPERILSWTNLSAYPFETFTSTGSVINSAINTTGGGACYTNNIGPLYIGETYTLTYTATVNSGNVYYCYLGRGVTLAKKSNDFVMTSGTHTVTLTVSVNYTEGNFVIETPSTCNFSISAISLVKN